MFGSDTQQWAHAFLSAFDEEAFCYVRFNDVDAFLPAGSLVTMYHCIHLGNDARFNVLAETNHLRWMVQRLQPGGVFLDVGAAIGQMTIPVALQRPGVSIYAFEPAQRARRLLIATLRRNEITGVRIIPAAISSHTGMVNFLERDIDPTGNCPWLAEASTIAAVGTTSQPREQTYEIEALTLDEFAKRHGIGGRNVVVKIDIEGYEIEALKGAQQFLATNRVDLAIDIHARPDGPEMTEDECRALLTPHGYRFERMGHVLLCERA